VSALRTVLVPWLANGSYVAYDGERALQTRRVNGDGFSLVQYRKRAVEHPIVLLGHGRLETVEFLSRQAACHVERLVVVDHRIAGELHGVQVRAQSGYTTGRVSRRKPVKVG
jgi:hypothetical protein